jgi:ABC-type multidrug transport system fused ATPase/permease subunit
MPMGRAFGRLEFDRICFSYELGQPVIRDIQLTIEPGTTVALVGPTGCGKSTLLNLLLRFYDPSAGEIRIDGIPIQHLDEGDLRRQIGIVPQDAVMFRASLADNIRYGTPSATMADVEAAAHAALLHELVRGLPHGYDTIIGEGGYPLSQGERQRVAIARAFCKDAPIIVLDEATSSLDVGSEAMVRVALTNLLKDRAVLVIAHRLSTVMNADRIVVMQAGRIEQVGTPRALLADRDGLFRKLYLRQFKALAKPKAIPISLVKGTTRRTEVALHER